MTRIFALLLLCAVPAGAFAAAAATTSKPPMTEDDKVIFAVGEILSGSVKPFALSEHEMQLVREGFDAGLHGKKQAMLTSGAIALAQVIALATLGFTSVYREGFETVLFVQALVLATDVGTVLLGVLAGIAATVLVGFAVFSLERKLPQKKMLMLTGAMVTWVLVVMVGTTVQFSQTVGWLPVTPIAGLRLPYWSGVWFGLYPTWEGVLLQLSAFVFVIGSYVAAEAVRKRRRNRAFARGPARGETLREPVR